MRSSLLLVLFACATGLSGNGAETAADLIIYGATPAGIAAAVQAKRMGVSAIVLEPTQRIGGLTTGGLGQTDIGSKESFGGIAREFYAAVRKWYDDPGHWTRQTFADYAPDGQCLGTKEADTMWTFEPSAALAILEGWEKRDGLTIHRGKRLCRERGKVKVAGEGEGEGGRRIISVETTDGSSYVGRIFLDCSYEGDLMAAACVPYAVGREANAVYGETINGIERRLSVSHQMQDGVDAYVKPGDPTSGLLPGVEPEDPRPDGAGDGRVQAYCFRMCLTDDPDNRIPFAKPDGYREADYEVLLRNLEAGPLDRNGLPWINSKMPNRKTDTNNRTGFSTDLIGGSNRYPEASDVEREEIALRHLRYQQGLMWTLANHPRVPERIRREVSRWGTCRDEFVGERGDGWQNQLYVREARRMVGAYVMTEHECLSEREAPQAVGLAAYGMDSHNCRRYADRNGKVRNEGNIERWTLDDGRRIRPYAIGYGALVPKRGDCSNLLVPVCLSASHMAFGSIRMEPVFFVLGQSAATAAALALRANCAVQDVPYDALRARLVADGQRLDPPPDPAKALSCRTIGPREPKPWEVTACVELTNWFSQVCSGGRVLVGGRDGVVFHVGDTDFAKEKGLLSGAFKNEEWVVKSFGADVVLNGGGTRGCLYAVYHFLEDACNIHWWEDGDTEVPRAMPLEFKSLDLRGRPFFSYREVYRRYKTVGDFRTAVRNRLNGNGWGKIPLAWGGGIECGPVGPAHAWDRLLPFAKYGKDHPEWYSLVGGKRIGGMLEGQFCLSCPELVPAVVRRLEEEIAKGERLANDRGLAKPRVYSCDMNDNKHFCECAACSNEVAAVGHSGQQLRFVNAVAAEIGKRHPEILLKMSAYLYSEDPPKTDIRAADNVLVEWCNTKSSLASPVSAPCNRFLREMTERWRPFAKNRLIWDYAVTFHPATRGWAFPSERHYSEKFRHYAAYGVTGLFWEHEMPEPADMYELKLFLECKLMEDPHADAAYLSDHFMYQFYGPKAYPHVKNARLALARECAAHGGTVSWFPRRSEFAWLTQEGLAEIKMCFDAAEKAVANESKRLARVKRARESVIRIERFGQEKLRAYEEQVQGMSELSAPSARAWRIETSPQAKSWERTAAAELELWLGAATSNACLRVAGREDLVFHVGDTDFAREKGLDLNSFKDEEWCVKSFGPDVVLAGGGRRGTLYAVYHFLEDECDVRFWMDDDVEISATNSLSLSRLDRRGRPFFGRRVIFRGIAGSERQAVRCRLNGNGDQPIPPELGGEGMVFGGPYHAHTWDRYLPFSTYGKAHPEWYSLVKGQRIGGQNRGQLCLTCPGLVDVFVGEIEKYIEKDRAKATAGDTDQPTLYCLSSNDNLRYCECTACRAEIERYGMSGYLLRFQNAVAEKVSAKHPSLYFPVSAYFETEALPKGGVRPASNLIVKVCNTTGNLVTSPREEENRAMAELLEGWGRLAPLNIHEYGITFGCQAAGRPFPSEFSIVDRYRFYAEKGVLGGLVELEEPECSDMYELKYYLTRRALEDPWADSEALVDEFLRRYYGPAGADVLSARRALLTACRERGGFIRFEAKPRDFDCFDDAVLASASRMFDAAEARVAADAKRLARVKRARSSVDRLVAFRWRMTVLTPPEPGVSDLPFLDFPVDREMWRPYMNSDVRFMDKAAENGGLAIGVAVTPKNRKLMGAPFGCGIRAFGTELKVEKTIGRPDGDGYRWYDLGEMTMPDREVLVWMTRSWEMQLNLYAPKFVGRKFRVRLHLKFTGSEFIPGSTEPSVVLADRAVFVPVKDVDDAGNRGTSTPLAGFKAGKTGK